MRNLPEANKMKALVTGAYGFLGRHTAYMLHTNGFAVTGIGNGSWSDAQARQYGISRWVESEVTLKSLIALKDNFDVIVHCAGSGSVGYSITEPFKDLNKTVLSAAAVLEYIRNSSTETRLVYPSSAGVYGAKADTPILEVSSLSPASPYGYHKKIVEDLCRSYSESYGLTIIIIRFFSIYGEGLKKQLLWDVCRKLSLATRDKPAELYGTGLETRDLLHIQDATNLIFNVLSTNMKQLCIVNGGTGIRSKISDVVAILGERIGIMPYYFFNGESRPGDPQFFLADISKAVLLGWEPSITLYGGLSRYVQWFRTVKL
jgi:UDP-glucose 4-epimerase